MDYNNIKINVVNDNSLQPANQSAWPQTSFQSNHDNFWRKKCAKYSYQQVVKHNRKFLSFRNILNEQKISWKKSFTWIQWMNERMMIKDRFFKFLIIFFYYYYFFFGGRLRMMSVRKFEFLVRGMYQKYLFWMVRSVFILKNNFLWFFLSHLGVVDLFDSLQ